MYNTIYVQDPICYIIGWFVGFISCYCLVILINTLSRKDKNDLQGKRKQNRSKRK